MGKPICSYWRLQEKMRNEKRLWLSQKAHSKLAPYVVDNKKVQEYPQWITAILY